MCLYTNNIYAYIYSRVLVVDDDQLFANNFKVLINNVKREICLLKLYEHGLRLPRVSDTFILFGQRNNYADQLNFHSPTSMDNWN